jgi:hypothetical protein
MSVGNRTVSGQTSPGSAGPASESLPGGLPGHAERGPDLGPGGSTVAEQGDPFAEPDLGSHGVGGEGREGGQEVIQRQGLGRWGVERPHRAGGAPAAPPPGALVARRAGRAVAGWQTSAHVPRTNRQDSLDISLAGRDPGRHGFAATRTRAHQARWCGQVPSPPQQRRTREGRPSRVPTPIDPGHRRPEGSVARVGLLVKRSGSPPRASVALSVLRAGLSLCPDDLRPSDGVGGVPSRW